MVLQTFPMQSANWSQTASEMPAGMQIKAESGQLLHIAKPNNQLYGKFCSFQKEYRDAFYRKYLKFCLALAVVDY